MPNVTVVQISNHTMSVPSPNTLLHCPHRAHKGADDLYVVSESDSEYLVDAGEGSCEGPGCLHRDPDGGYKHLRGVRYAIGERPITNWIDPTAVND